MWGPRQKVVPRSDTCCSVSALDPPPIPSPTYSQLCIDTDTCPASHFKHAISIITHRDAGTGRTPPGRAGFSNLGPVSKPA